MTSIPVESAHPHLTPVNESMSSVIPATASAEYMASQAPEKIKSLANLQARVFSGFFLLTEPANMENLWRHWSYYNPTSVVASPQQSQQNMNNKILYDAIAVEESRVIDIVDSLGRPVQLPSNEEVAQVSLNPSLQAYSTLKWASIVTVRGHSAYHNMLKFFRVLGQGSYGTAYGVSQRSPEIDLELMTQ